MPNRPNKRERLIMPPQFLDSPSERRGNFWQSVLIFPVFGCGTVLVLASVLIFFGVVQRIIPGLSFPVKDQAFALLLISIWLFLSAVLLLIDGQRVHADSNGLGSAMPWLMAIVGIVFLVLGWLSL